VHGKVDLYCSPVLAERLHARAPGNKEIVWLDAQEHVDLYDVEPYVTQAVDATSAFLRKHLVTQG
jgi:fermentation-respiration switch protein FrsA (DUF1100 family)